jgi:isopropylmalate/homocitrate/citramalate synthase
MVEVGIAEYFGIGEALGIIGTMFIVLYFSRKQMQSLSVDIETKVLSDLDEKMHSLTQMAVEKPELIRIVSNVESDLQKR